MSCLHSTEVQTGQSLAIVGVGPVAQTLVLFARLSGIRPLVVFGRRPIWAARFAALGADAYVTPEEFPSTAQAILDRGGFDRVIEAVGARQALARCLELVSSSGRVNVYVVAPESEPYDHEHLTDPRVFRGQVAEAETHEQLLRWVEEGKVRLDDWISHTMPWTDYLRGFEMVRDKTANKVILTW